jgi:hypothetical protein
VKDEEIAAILGRHCTAGESCRRLMSGAGSGAPETSVLVATNFRNIG